MYSRSPHTHSSARSCKTEESLKRLLLSCCCALQQLQWPTYGFSIVLLGSSSAESNPAITCQIHDFEGPEHAPRSPPGTQTWAQCTGGPLACPRAESARKDPRVPEKSVHVCIQNKSHLYLQLALYKLWIYGGFVLAFLLWHRCFVLYFLWM